MIEIRRATSVDLDAIDAIETGSFSADRFARRNLSRMIAGGRTVFLLAFLDQNPVGYLALSFRKGASVARIYSLAVLESARGNGVARGLIEAAMALAKAQGSAAVRLEVRTSNAAARRLYAAAQFCLRDTRIAYYEDGETALIYERETGAADKDTSS